MHDTTFDDLLTRPVLSVERHPLGNRVRVTMAGEIDMSAEHEVRAGLGALAVDGGLVELDLGGVTFMDSTGVRLLIELRNRRSLDQPFVITTASPPVRRVLDVTGLSTYFGLPAVATPAAAPDTADSMGPLVSDLVSTLPARTTASVTLIRRGVTTTLLSIGDTARAADAAQYQADSGPTLTAARSGVPVGLDRIVNGPGRYEEFKEVAVSRRISAVLSVPVPLTGSGRAALTLYAESSGAFADPGIVARSGATAADVGRLIDGAHID